VDAGVPVGGRRRRRRVFFSSRFFLILEITCPFSLFSIFDLSFLCVLLLLLSPATITRPMPSSLVADAAALVDNFAAGQEQLRAFAEAHPVENIFSELSSSASASISSPSSSIDAASVAVVARALGKVFADAQLASELLPATCPFAVAAVRSQESPEQLRALAVEALGRCVAAGVVGGGAEEEEAATTLVAALGDSSASVGAAAERGGRIAASTEEGARALLRAGLVAKMSLGGDDEGGNASSSPSSSPALARARALSVAAAALSAGAGPAAALKEAGAFAAVAEQLSLESGSDDPLSAASALATISDAVSSVLEGGKERGAGEGSEEDGDSASRAAAVGALLAAEVGRPLARLLASSSGTLPKVLFAVRMQAMQTAAKLVAAAVGGRSGGGEANCEAAAANNENENDDDSTDAAAVAAAPSSAAAASSSPIPSPASPIGGLAAALLASIERSLDEEAAVGRDGEIADEEGEAPSSSSEEEASLLALAELASTAGGAALVAAASPDALNDAARIALGGRGDSSCRLAALHALASVAGVERMKRERRRREQQQREGTALPEQPAGVLLAGAGEAVLASALQSGAATRAAAAAAGGGGGDSASPAGVLLSLISRQPLLDEKVAALRLTLALCARPWGAAEVAMHPGLLARLVDVAADSASATAEWRHACCLALSETTAKVLEPPSSPSASSPLGPTQLSALAAARPAIEVAVRAGPHGIGGPAPRFVATRAAN